MTRAKKTDAGFSLLETLLGLTLTAMIGLLMMGSLQMGTRIWERQDKAVQPGTEQLVIGQATEWLSQALRMSLRNPDAEAFAPFIGDADSVSFLYPAQGMGAAPGIYAIDLELVEAPDCGTGKTLMMRATRIIIAEEDADRAAPPVERRRLAACLEQPSFVFWGANATEQVAAWRESWSEHLELPQVVRLRSFSADGAEHAVFTQRLLEGGM
jgi:hypothetical protein